MKIHRSTWRRWGRLVMELGVTCVWLWATWGVLLGVTRVNDDTLAPDVRNGDLVFFGRFLTPNAEDLVIWPDGQVGRWSGKGSIAGRAVFLWRVRGI